MRIANELRKRGLTVSPAILIVLLRAAVAGTAADTGKGSRRTAFEQLGRRSGARRKAVTWAIRWRGAAGTGWEASLCGGVNSLSFVN